MRIVILLCALLASAYGQGCSCDEPLRVGGFNTYQNPIAPYREQRFQAMINYFNDTEAHPFDILCLSDLWGDEVRNRTHEELLDVFPEWVTSESLGRPKMVPRSCPSPSRPECSDDDVQNILRCALINNCLVAGSESNAVQCAIENCGDQINGTSEACVNCLAFGNGFDAENRLITCTANRRAEGTGLISACEFGYGGKPDLAILSRFEIQSSATYHYTISPYVQWTALWAKINTTALGEVNIISAHIVPNLGFVNTTRENYAQIQELIQFIRQQDPNYSGMDILVGDFNTVRKFPQIHMANQKIRSLKHNGTLIELRKGPETETTASHLQRGYNYIVQQGWSDVALKRQDNSSSGGTITAVNCTFCTKTNPLAAQIETNKTWALDHVFVKQDATVCVPRAYVFATENNVSVQNPNGTRISIFLKKIFTISANCKDVPISYHYGFGSYLCPSQVPIGASPPSPIATFRP